MKSEDRNADMHVKQEKSRNRSLLILIAGILLVHFIVLFLFIQSGSSDSSVFDRDGSSNLFPRSASGSGDPYSSDPGEFFGDPSLAMYGRDGRGATKRIEYLTLDYSGALKDALRNMPGSKIASVSGILIDMNTGKVIWHKNAKKKRSIASLSKIMTLLLAYQTASDPRSGITLKSQVTCDRMVLQIPPSKVDLQPGEIFPLEDLMRAAAIRSANDAAYQIGAFIGGGDVDQFVERMNTYAASIGMDSTTYFNPHGLPGKTAALDNSSTVEDIAKLCYIYAQYPYLMELAGTRRGDFRIPGHPDYVPLVNHNNLLPGAKYGTEGVNGIKTGFTNRAGSCLAVTCIRGDKHLLAVLAGYPSA